MSPKLSLPYARLDTELHYERQCLQQLLHGTEIIDSYCTAKPAAESVHRWPKVGLLARAAEAGRVRFLTW